MPYSRLFKASLAFSLALSLFGTASAGCNHESHAGGLAAHTLPSLSSWTPSSSMGHTSFSSSSYSSPTYMSQSFSSSMSTSSFPDNCPAGTTAQADGTCLDTNGTYSSSTYASATVADSVTTSSGLTFTPFTSAETSSTGYTMPSLGAGESLQATQCPVDIYNPDDHNVRGCYNVVRSAPAMPTAQLMPMMFQPMYVHYNVIPMTFFPVMGGACGFSC